MVPKRLKSPGVTKDKQLRSNRIWTENFSASSEAQPECDVERAACNGADLCVS